MCDFYYAPASAPCRSVQMLAKALGVQLNLKQLEMWVAKEHLKPDFVKLNPQHTVPTLVDNDFVLWESRAILIYLVEKYGKNDKFYPRDAKKRAIVNQRMYFDMGTLYKSFGDYYYPQFMRQEPADPEKFVKMEEAVKLLDGFLADSDFVAGNDVSIADYALFSSFSTFDVVGFDFSKYENVTRWYKHCEKNMPGVEENEIGMEVMKKIMEDLKTKSQAQ